MQPNGSVFQLLELMKYENNPKIKTALVNVNQEDDNIRYEWLVFDKHMSSRLELTDRFLEKINYLVRQFEKHPELDPLIPRNLRKRAIVESIYNKAMENESIYDISNEFDQIKDIILTSERKFCHFTAQNEGNIITEELIGKYLINLQDRLQKLVNRVGRPNGIDSCAQFKYHWAKEVVLDYYERIQEYMKE